MGGPSGAHPGRVLEYDAHHKVVKSLPTPSDDAAYPFNPHGVSIDEAHNLMVTSDYVCPVSTLHVGGLISTAASACGISRSALSFARFPSATWSERWMFLIPGDHQHRAFDERRLVVSDYFLVEHLVPGGVINGEGDMKVHVINVFRDHIELDKNLISISATT
jgi:hypothetical protein